DAKAWAEQKASTASKVKTGAITAGIGAVGGLVGNLAINSGEKNKNQADKIIADYDKKATSAAQDTGVTPVTPAPENVQVKTAETSEPVSPDIVPVSTDDMVAPDGEATDMSQVASDNTAKSIAGVDNVEPLTEAQMRQKMQKVVNICEAYNQNGVIGKFVIDSEVHNSSLYQRAYCIFVKAVASGGGVNDSVIAASASKYQEKLKKFALDGYVYAPDNAQGLRCRNLFKNADLGGIPWRGQDLPTGQQGFYTACSFLINLKIKGKFSQ
ncbi:MAG: hypothetical protein K2I81_01180, partial [Alphaproteobacteria bacterium]|nr:hypothetical protein [Alphaproteobacteria bacterium]